jgi:hypothetical protein
VRLPRLQLFEFNDAPWTPPLLRETIVEALSRSLRWGGLLRGLVEPFSRFVADTRAEEVLDLCAGAGGPAAIFLEELTRSGGPVPRFVLSDLFPRPEAWAALRASHPGRIDFVPGPVDATRIPPALGRGRPRVIINALHHFPPAVAQPLLLGAAEGAPGLFIADAVVRNPLRFAALFPAGVGALLAAPLLAKDRRLARALLTWFTPLALGASLWDGSISAMRAYGREDLEAFVAPLGDAWRWSSGEFAFGGVGRGLWFSGVRR